MAGRNYHQSRFTPTNPDKYVGDIHKIFARSSWERKFMIECDTNPNILKWGSEISPIRYYSTAEGKTRRYFVDFHIQVLTKTGNRKNIMIEIKPKAQTMPPRKRRQTKRFLEECKTYQINQDKWKAAAAWCNQHGWQFSILTEDDLGIKQ